RGPRLRVAVTGVNGADGWGQSPHAQKSGRSCLRSRSESKRKLREGSSMFHRVDRTECLKRPRRARAVRGTQRRLRPFLEVLEDYLLLSTFYITNNNDQGPGSLRNAIDSVNLDPLSNGQDIIEPNSSSIGTISPGSALP